MVEEKTKTEPKKRKKRWFQIVAPKQFNHREIGETTVYAPSEVMGKTTCVNLMTVMDDMRKQHVNVKFKVTEVKDNVGYTELVAYCIIPAYMKRIVRRNAAKLEESLLLSTQDGKRVRIKPILVTRAKTKSSVLKAIRHRASDYLRQYVAKTAYAVLVNDVVTSALQSNLYRHLRKTYPLKTCEIRVLEIASEKKPSEKKKKRKEGPLEKKEVKAEEKPNEVTKKEEREQRKKIRPKPEPQREPTKAETQEEPEKVNEEEKPE